MDSITSTKDALLHAIKKLYTILQLSKVFELVLLVIWKLLFDRKPLFSM